MEVEVDNSGRRLAFVEADRAIIRKAIDRQGRVSVAVNERRYGQAEFLGLLQLSGFQRSSPVNFVQQGRVKQIAQLDERALFKLIHEIVGMNAYRDGKSGGLEVIEQAKLLEEQAYQMLEEFRERLNELEVDKEDFVAYEQNFKSGNR